MNGKEKQNRGTELMIVSLRKMISYLSNVITVKRGDEIPIGAEFVKRSYRIECEIKGLAIFETHSKQKKLLGFVLIFQEILFQLENERGFFFYPEEVYYSNLLSSCNRVRTHII
ncbi:fumarylacetoacetate hydrolase family protein [Peribacillus simplex]|uniref:fumarylacetoacetate hydrolase family protein n=1 Tax=Peribacillus simplex TaxID=1478 RepID=UPI003D298783